MAAYQARTQFSGSQEGIVFFLVSRRQRAGRLRASLASKGAMLSLVIVFLADAYAESDAQRIRPT